MQPENVFRCGPCFASVFVSEVVKNGTIRQVRTVTFMKRSVENGEWRSTTSLSVNDLPKAALVLEKAYEYLTAISPVIDDEEQSM
jgi:hypothetical protein